MSELQEVRDELGEVKTGLAVLSTDVKNHTEVMGKIVQKHEDILHGNPHGLVVQVDRLNQNQQRRKWVIRVIGGSLVAILIKFLTDLFLHFH